MHIFILCKAYNVSFRIPEKQNLRVIEGHRYSLSTQPGLTQTDRGNCTLFCFFVCFCFCFGRSYSEGPGRSYVYNWEWVWNCIITKPQWNHTSQRISHIHSNMWVALFNSLHLNEPYTYIPFFLFSHEVMARLKSV